MKPEILQEIPMQEKGEISEGDFYNDLSETMGIWLRHPERLKQKKEEFINEHPERSQEIEIFFDFPEYCQINQEIKEKKRWSEEERLKKFENLTERNFLVTNYLLHNYQNKEGLVEFWKKLRSLSKDLRGGEHTWALSKSGITAQACTYHVLEKLGFKPELSIPYDDAFKKEDLTCYLPEKTVIQTKTKKEWEDLKIEKIKHISYPTVSSDNARISSHELEYLPHFQGSLDELKKQLGKEVVSLKLKIPRNFYDHDTGIPTEEGLKEFQEEFEKYK